MRTDRTARIVAAMLAAAVVLGALPACSQRVASTSGGAASREVAPPSAGTSTEYYGGAPTAPDAAAPAQDSAKGSASPASAPVADRMVIRNANVRVEVTKVSDAVEKVRAMAKSAGAVISSLQLASDDGGSPEPMPTDSERIVTSGMPFKARITVLVPVAKFDAFRTDAAKLGKLLSESSADDDVTQAHADLKARLTNAKAEEARLRTFFEQAKSVKDMLDIERELARVRGDIESMTAQLQTMERQAAMATLTIELTEPQPIVRPSDGIDWGFRDALTTGIQAMVGLLRAAIVVVIATAPVWLLAIALVLVLRWRMRARKARAEA